MNLQKMLERAQLKIWRCMWSVGIDLTKTVAGNFICRLSQMATTFPRKETFGQGIMKKVKCIKLFYKYTKTASSRWQHRVFQMAASPWLHFAPTWIISVQVYQIIVGWPHFRYLWSTTSTQGMQPRFNARCRQTDLRAVWWSMGGTCPISSYLWHTSD